MIISPVKVWRNQKKIAKMLGKTGKIIAWTVIRVPPADFSYQAPYIVAVVKINGGKNIIAQVTDCKISDLKFGQKVKTVIRRTSKPGGDEVIPYGVKVKPI